MGDPWDEAELIQLVNTITYDNPFIQRDTEYGRRRDLLFQRRFVAIPGVTVDAYGNPKEQALQYRSPEIEDDAHAFKNRMLAAPVKINVAALKKTTKAEESAQRLEDFLYRYYERWRDSGVFDGALFDMASIGVGWLHLNLNIDLLPLVPDPQETANVEEYFQIAEDELKKFTEGERPDLFTLEHIDPATMYWSPDDSILIQKALVPLNPLVQAYGKRGKQIYIDDRENVVVTTLSPGQNVMTFRSYWSRMVTLFTVETDEYCYHLLFNNRTPTGTAGELRGTVLGTYKNYFGMPTFFPVYGEKTGDLHPLYRYRPLLNGKYQTVPIKNVMYTSMMTAGVEAAQQRYSLEWAGPGPAPEDDANQVVTVNEDGVIVPPAGYKLVNSGLQVGPDLPGSIKMIEGMDRYGYPKALARPEEVTASSGYDRARQQDAVASLLDPPLSHFSAALTKVAGALKNAVREIDLPITVRSTQMKASAGRPVMVQKEATIKPEDVAEETDISIGFSSITVFSRIAMQEEGLKLMQADQQTETFFQREVMGIDNLEDFRDERALDKILKKADDFAVALAEKTLEGIASAAEEQAIQQNNIPTPGAVAGMLTPPPPIVATNGQMLRADRGPGQPVGPGQAMPVSPTPPAPAELGQPEAMPMAGVT